MTPSLSRFVMSSARRVAAGFVAVACLGPRPALAQDPGGPPYRAALAREHALAPHATVADDRAVIAAYEAVVRKFPRSGYCDDALWHAAGIASRAYAISNDDVDLRAGRRLLQTLKTEYPTSAFVKHIDERLATFSPATFSPATSSPATRAAAKPAAAAPAVRKPDAPATPARMPAPRQAPAPTPEPTQASAPTPASAPAPAVALRGIKQSPLPNGERVVIELSREADFTTTHGADPNQIVVTLSDTGAAAALVGSVPSRAGGLISGVHVIAAAASTQVVVALSGHPLSSVYPLYSPFRLVIDVEAPPVDAHAGPPAVPARVDPPVVIAPAPPAADLSDVKNMSAPSAPTTTDAPSLDDARDVRSAPIAPAVPAAAIAGSYSLSRQLGLSVSRIVIDPGHGGHDPGAQANGINESDLTLDVALRLEQLLLAEPGMHVVLTRRTDEFVPLEERTAIANRENADLFLSIHANASAHTTARGVETYFMNVNATPGAEAVAARENATSTQTMGNLPEMVKTMTLTNKMAESHEFAALVQASLAKKLKPADPVFADLGVKQAPFVVLIGAHMPSVLAEISFLTNRSEAGLLKQSVYRQRIAQALFDAIVKYQDTLKHASIDAGK